MNFRIITRSYALILGENFPGRYNLEYGPHLNPFELIFLKIHERFSVMVVSMSATVTQRGAVTRRPSSSIRKPMVRRFERTSR